MFFWKIVLHFFCLKTNSPCRNALWKKFVYIDSIYFCCYRWNKGILTVTLLFLSCSLYVLWQSCFEIEYRVIILLTIQNWLFQIFIIVKLSLSFLCFYIRIVSSSIYPELRLFVTRIDIVLYIILYFFLYVSDYICRYHYVSTTFFRCV